AEARAAHDVGGDLAQDDRLGERLGGDDDGRAGGAVAIGAAAERGDSCQGRRAAPHRAVSGGRGARPFAVPVARKAVTNPSAARPRPRRAPARPGAAAGAPRDGGGAGRGPAGAGRGGGGAGRGAARGPRGGRGRRAARRATPPPGGGPAREAEAPPPNLESRP